MPTRVVRKIDRLAKKTSQTPAQIIEAGVMLYEQQVNKGADLKNTDEEIDQIVNDPKKRAIFHEVMSALMKRGARGIDEAVRTARAKAGGTARANTLSEEEKREIGRKGAEKRWGKKDLE